MRGEIDPRTPCLIGVGQCTVHPADGPAPEPLELWEDVARRAAADSGGVDVLAAVDQLDVVYCQSWSYDDPPARLAARLGLTPRHQRYSGIGGTTPQVLVAEAAQSILAGELDAALVVGGETLATRRILRKAGERPEWSFPEPSRSPFPFEAPFHPAEVAHEVFQAWLTFALWDVARRAHLGVAPDEYRRSLGELFSPFTEVAAANPQAWFPIARGADELVTATADNRMVGYPYTKYMVAVMDVDMAAAVIVASHERADALGVPPERRVYLRGWCYATDPVYVAEHDPTWSSPAMAAAGAEALRRAGVGIDDVAHLDLYSCFTSSVLFACDALGIDPTTDGRSLTVTGGLPYHGGPGSCYLLHSLSAMADVLRTDPGSYGLVSGVGMHMTKHCFGVWSTEPGAFRPPDSARVDALPIKAIRDTATGPATVVTYSVVHDRSGEVDWGLAVCDLPEGDRCYARIEDPTLLQSFESEEWVGRQVRLVEGKPGVNLLQAL
ncbi:MAG TPA: acetyl-CoA acetyltransferase [Acidimicrobiales bacterium]|jgi:acetyl-CoA C-acetyltransferase